MKLINPKADKKRHGKIKAVCGTLITLIMALFVGAGVFLVVWLKLPLTLYTIFIVGVCVLVGGVISFFVGFAFSKPLQKTQQSVELDFEQNLAVCNCCGRYLTKSNLQWKNGKLYEKEKVYGDSGVQTSYQYSLSVTGKCPNCGTTKGIVIVEDAGSSSWGFKHIAFTDKDKEYRKDNTKRIDDQKLVQERLRSDKLDAEIKLDEYFKLGYTVDRSGGAAKEKKKPKRETYYDVYLDDVGNNLDAVLKAASVWKNSSAAAKHALDVCGLFESGLSKDIADMIVEDLLRAGAVVHMEEAEE